MKGAQPLVVNQIVKDIISDNGGNEVMFDLIMLLHLQQDGREAIS